MNGESFVSQWRRAIRDDVQLSSDAKVDGYVLSTYMSNDGHRGRPGGALLVIGTGRSLRSVRRGLTELKAKGYLLEVVHGAPGRASEYNARIPTGDGNGTLGTGTSAHSALDGNGSSARGARTSARSDRDECQGGTPTSQELIKNYVHPDDLDESLKVEAEPSRIEIGRRRSGPERHLLDDLSPGERASLSADGLAAAKASDATYYRSRGAHWRDAGRDDLAAVFAAAAEAVAERAS